MKTAGVRCSLVTESAVVVEWRGDGLDRASLRRAWQLVRELDRRPLPGLVESVAAYATVTLFFDPHRVDVSSVVMDIERILSGLDDSWTEAGRTIEVPVCYGAEFGPDLEFLAGHAGLSVGQVVELHSSVEYLVYLIGFVPGFPYLGGLPACLAAPRLASPRPAVPAGSVAIGGEQTGIYPRSTPGGWRLIGRTPLVLFDPRARPPTLLMPGDRVRFRPISPDEFSDMPRSSLGAR